MLDPRVASWVLAGASTLVAAAICLAMRSSVAIWPLLAVIATESLLLALFVIYRWIRPDPIISDIAGSAAVIIWCAMMAGVIGLIGLRAHAPLFDPRLAYWDRELGLDTRPFVLWVTNTHGIGSVLAVAYESSSGLAFVTVAVLACLRQSERLWKFVFVFSGSILLCTLLSIAFPAVGAFSFYNLPSTVLDHLPAGSGTYHLSKFWHIVRAVSPKLTSSTCRVL